MSFRGAAAAEAATALLLLLSLLPLLSSPHLLRRPRDAPAAPPAATERPASTVRWRVCWMMKLEVELVVWSKSRRRRFVPPSSSSLPPPSSTEASRPCSPPTSQTLRPCLHRHRQTQRSRPAWRQHARPRGDRRRSCSRRRLAAPLRRCPVPPRPSRRRRRAPPASSCSPPRP